MEGHVTQAVPEQSRVLLLASPTEIREHSLCRESISTAPAADQHVIQLTYNRRPAAVVDDWRTHAELPASLVVICPESQTSGTELPEGVQQEPVPAGDLTGMGIAVLEYLDEWDADRPITVCVDSVATMLQYTESQQLFKFLHTLNGRCLGSDATVHAHLDPATQDEQTIATLSTLYDAIVRVEDDGWTVTES